TNFRYLALDDTGELFNAATIDVSFISLSIILKNLYKLLDNEGEVIALIKPQFEAGRENIGKKGVVIDPKIHQQVLENVIKDIGEIGFCIEGLSFSPIKGPEGNIEFLAYLSKKQDCVLQNYQIVINNIVKDAHNTLK